jgi:hypothetical protein
LSTSTIDFQKATGDASFKVVTSGTNPVASTVQVSKTVDTNDKLLLAFDVKAENADMLLQKLPVNMTTSGTLSQVAKNVKLYANGTLVTSETPVASVIFGNTSKLNYKLPKDTYVKFEVKADLNSTGTSFTNYTNGTTISASYTTTGLSVELDNANRDTVTTITGSATGENQTLRTTGVMVTMGSTTSTFTSNTSGQIASRAYSIPLVVKAFDDTVYLAQTANAGTAVTSTNALSFSLKSSAGVLLAAQCTGANAPYQWCTGAGAGTPITGSATLTSSDATIQSSAFRVDAGSTKNFILTVTVSGTAGAAQSQYKVGVNDFQTFTDAALTTGSAIQTLTPTNSYETAYQPVNL